MRLGWIVLAHNRPAQTARLIARVNSPADSVFLHVDRAVPLAPFIRALGGGAGQVSMLARHRSRWGTYGIVSATLGGMRAAVDAGCDYVLVVSGQDYPIKPVGALREHLSEASGAAFMLYFGLPNPDWTVRDEGLWRLNRRHYRFGRWGVHVPNRWTPFVPLREMPKGQRPFAGSNWWSLPSDCARYVLDFLAENPDYVRFYRRAALPAESLFHTILLNSPLRERVVFNDLRYIVWRPGASHPETLDESHLPTLERTPAFLARKFDAARHPRVLDLIDERMLGLLTAA